MVFVLQKWGLQSWGESCSISELSQAPTEVLVRGAAEQEDDVGGDPNVAL